MAAAVGALGGQIYHNTERFEGEPAEKKLKIEALLPSSCDSQEHNLARFYGFEGEPAEKKQIEALHPSIDSQEESQEYEDDDFPGDGTQELVVYERTIKVSMPCIQFAIDENNKQQDTNYEYVELVKLHLDYTGGSVYYYFTLKVKEKDDPLEKAFMCRAEVFEAYNCIMSLEQFYKDSKADRIYLRNGKAA